LSRLIENFLTFSRLERNRQKFDFRPTPPQRVVRNAVDAVGGRFPVQVDVTPVERPFRLPRRRPCRRSSTICAAHP
jgi:hypothetical protein